MFNGKKKKINPFPIASSKYRLGEGGPGVPPDLHILAEEKKVIKKGKGVSEEQMAT